MDDAKDTPMILCTSCGRMQVGSPHLCEHCGAPLTPHASTDPILGIMARGFAASQATTNPRKPIVVIGIWLWMAPAVVLGLMFSSATLSSTLRSIIDRQWLDFGLGLLALTASVAMVLILGAILVRTTDAFLRGKARGGDSKRDAADAVADDENREQPTQCLACGQAMAEDSNQCSACGWSFSDYT